MPPPSPTAAPPINAQGDLDRALQDFDRAIELDPRLAVAFTYRGAAYGARGDWDQAIQEYSRAIELDPKDVAAFYNRGIAHSRRQQWDFAARDFDQSDQASIQMTLRPTAIAAWPTRSCFDSTPPSRDFDRAVELNPKDAAAFAFSGGIHLRRGEIDRAIQDYDRALRIDPNDATTFYNRGVAYGTKKEWDLAVQDYDQALRLEPKFAAALYGRGVAKEQMGGQGWRGRRYRRGQEDRSGCGEVKQVGTRPRRRRTASLRLAHDHERAGRPRGPEEHDHERAGTRCPGDLRDLDVRGTKDRRPLGELVLDELLGALGRGVRRRNGGIALEEFYRGGIGHRLAAGLVEPVEHVLRQAGRTEDEG